MRASDQDLPHPVLLRLPRYLTRVCEHRQAGSRWVSSTVLARSLGLTSSTVRQDLSHLALTGKSRRGYETTVLEGELRRELGGDRPLRLVIVGAGLLGSALALHGDLAENGFETCGLFDRDPAVIGKRVGKLTVRGMEALDRVVTERKVAVGVIAVPAASAQQVADRLLLSGVQGLLNLAHAPVQAPSRIPVVDTRILAGLQELAHRLKVRACRAAPERNRKTNGRMERP